MSRNTTSTTRRIRCSAPMGPDLWCLGAGAQPHACGQRLGKKQSPEQETQAVPQRRTAAYRATLEEDAELLKIFERTYGPIERDPLAAFRPVQKRERPDFDAQQWEILPEYPAGGRLQYHLCVG
mgnify:CR=1 FL=1